MILLTASKMPEGLDRNTLATTVSLLFPSAENEEYIEKISSRANDTSATESLFALALLYDLITELGIPDTYDLKFARGEMGKPYFIDSEIKFNISHSKGYVACAVSVGEELGVDIEASELTEERVERLAKRFFSESEQKELKISPKSFSRRWSEKESRAKFFGQSVENILSADKISPNNQYSEKIRLHSFAIGDVPISLCTKEDFSTISFTVQ